MATRTARLTRNVARGIHRLEHAHVNCYLLEDDDRDAGLTLIDTAFPATWPLLQRALEAIGRSPEELRAVVLTHAHFDHLGMARRLREEWDLPLWGHRDDQFIASHPYRYAHESPRLLYAAWYPAILPIMARMTAAGALGVHGVDDLRPLEPGEEVDVPGHPTVLFTPGHTYGHCALHLPDRDAILSGDALVTFNPYTAESGPQVVSAAATADLDMAFASLDAIEQTGARTLLPGHGDPWLDGVASAVAGARAAGPS
jgi:glyoxylase-like metal-dependent hydrolase (beta-lactamase superfamily II)